MRRDTCRQVHNRESNDTAGNDRDFVLLEWDKGFWITRLYLRIVSGYTMPRATIIRLEYIYIHLYMMEGNVAMGNEEILYLSSCLTFSFSSPNRNSQYYCCINCLFIITLVRPLACSDENVYITHWCHFSDFDRKSLYLKEGRLEWVPWSNPYSISKSNTSYISYLYNPLIVIVIDHDVLIYNI